MLGEDDRGFTVKSTPLANILHHWWSDDEFLDKDGNPTELPFAGPRGSFSALVKKYGGDIPPGAMRTELKRVGAVEVDKEGNVKAIKRSIRPNTAHENLCAALSHGVYAHLANVAHNTNPEIDDVGWGQRTAFTAKIREKDIPRIRRICNDQIGAAAESFDDLFMAYEKIEEPDEKGFEYRPVAVSICYFEELEDKYRSLWRD